jgi:hypothetical protein
MFGWLGNIACLAETVRQTVDVVVNIPVANCTRKHRASGRIPWEGEARAGPVPILPSQVRHWLPSFSLPLQICDPRLSGSRASRPLSQ